MEKFGIQQPVDDLKNTCVFMKMSRTVSTLRLLEDHLLRPNAERLFHGEYILIQVKHDSKNVHLNNSIYDYYEKEVVVPRIEQTLRRLYPNYDISIYDV